MKKQIYIIIAVVITALFMVNPAYAENERLEMNTENYGSLKVIENDAVLNDVTKYQNKGQYYENGKFIRYYRCPSAVNFILCDNLEDLISDFVTETLYMRINTPVFYKYKIADDSVIDRYEVDASDQEYIQSYVLNYEYVLNQLPQSPSIQNMYYFEFFMPDCHDAIYFETSSGDYIMFRAEEGGSIHLFTADEFHEYAQELYDYAMEHNYDENGEALYGGNGGSVEINPGDYTSLSFRAKPVIKWYHIVGGAIIAVALLSVAATMIVRLKKRNKAKPQN